MLSNGNNVNKWVKCLFKEKFLLVNFSVMSGSINICHTKISQVTKSWLQSKGEVCDISFNSLTLSVVRTFFSIKYTPKSVNFMIFSDYLLFLYKTKLYIKPSLYCQLFHCFKISIISDEWDEKFNWNMANFKLQLVSLCFKL